MQIRYLKNCHCEEPRKFLFAGRRSNPSLVIPASAKQNGGSAILLGGKAGIQSLEPSLSLSARRAGGRLKHMRLCRSAAPLHSGMTVLLDTLRSPTHFWRRTSSSSRKVLRALSASVKTRRSSAASQAFVDDTSCQIASGTSYPRNGYKGFALMGVIGLLILLGLFTTVGLSLVASSSGSYANLVQGAQAFAISRAGAEWYIEQLNLDTDWSDQSSQTRLFAQGSFTIDSFAYDPASDRLTFTSTGTITSNMAEVDRRENLCSTFQFCPL